MEMAAKSLAESGFVRQMVPYSQAWGPVASVILVALGWVWISRDNDRRESRKEIRTELNDLRDLIRDIEMSARSYFRTTPDDPESDRLSSLIKRSLQTLAGRLIAIKLRWKELDLDSDLTSFRRRITSGDFDSRQRRAISSTDLLILEIENAGQSLIDAIERAFATSFGRFKH